MQSDRHWRCYATSKRIDGLPQHFGLGAEWHVRADGSEDIIAQGAPRDFITVPPLPSGIYVLTATASGRTETITVLAAPERLPSVEELTGKSRLWGMTLALYGLRSARNSGLGDFEDLANVAEAAAGKGASFLGINPLHNMGFCDHLAISPYSPSHRGFLNTAYIALDKIPGLDTDDLSAFSDLRACETVPYLAHKPAHNAALDQAYARFTMSATKDAKTAFATFKKNTASDLNDFARFEALSEIYGAGQGGGHAAWSLSRSGSWLAARRRRSVVRASGACHRRFHRCTARSS